MDTCFEFTLQPTYKMNFLSAQDIGYFKPPNNRTSEVNFIFYCSNLRADA